MGHTKGKWKIQCFDNKHGYFIVCNDRTIGNIDRGHKSEAQLIAAAPELLEACKRALSRYSVLTGFKVLQEDAEFIQQSINKAEGNK